MVGMQEAMQQNIDAMHTLINIPPEKRSPTWPLTIGVVVNRFEQRFNGIPVPTHHVETVQQAMRLDAKTTTRLVR